VARTQLNFTKKRILKWKGFDLSFFNTYMDALNANPALLQEYAAELARVDAMKDTRAPV
jgi:hypothetical protein